MAWPSSANTAGRAWPPQNILMDVPTYDAYAEFGTTYDAKGNPIKDSARRDLLELTDIEWALYERLTDPRLDGYRRVEQERGSRSRSPGLPSRWSARPGPQRPQLAAWLSTPPALSGPTASPMCSVATHR